MSSNKRQKLSGAAYRKQREERSAEYQRSAGTMHQFLIHSDALPLTLPAPDLEPSITFAIDETESFQVDRMNTTEDGSSTSDFDLELNLTIETYSENDSVQQSANINVDLELFSDAGVWNIPLPDPIRVEIVLRGPNNFQNKDGPFKSIEKSGANPKGEIRALSKDWFYHKLENGEKVHRSWMLYSPSNGCLYCFCCRLFSGPQLTNQTQSDFVIKGFKTWWKLNPKVVDHERSVEHNLAFDKWKEMAMRLDNGQTLDRSLQMEIDAERKKWVNVLNRIVDVILYLAKQNLPLRGHRESLNEEGNPGNFLELIKLISKYDPVLREHVTYIRLAKKMTLSYLSPMVQNEFIELLANQVRQKIVEEIKEAKYYAILFDSTPDLSHTDQMSQIIRFVQINDSTVQVVEYFIDFISFQRKTAKDITQTILNKLNYDGLPIEDCRGQGYDNAATMAGIHTGVQRQIRNVNPKAEFVACANHTLNLAGVHAAGVSVSSITFFGTVERAYSFFSSSTHRWDIMNAHIPKVLKRIVETRWSARNDAVKVIHSHFDNVIDALEQLTGIEENSYTRGDANIVIASLTTFPFLCYLGLWGKVLPEVDAAQKYLQKKGLGLDQTIVKIHALRQFLHEERDRLVDDAMFYATTKCEEMDISITRRIRKKKRMYDEETGDKGNTLQEEFRKDMLQVVDQLWEEINRRFEQMHIINQRFGFTQFSILMDPDRTEFIGQRIDALVAIYDELDGVELKTEVGRFRRHVKSSDENNQVIGGKDITALDLLQWMVKWGFRESLPNLSIVLRIFLTMCVSIASCERSFSKLKLIKSYLRSTMNQVRLTSLAILSIERKLTEGMNFEDVIKDFASMKARKKSFSK